MHNLVVLGLTYAVELFQALLLRLVDEDENQNVGDDVEATCTSQIVYQR
jgi:hypothetical protein